MKLGHHFGKRKPRWNFFTNQYQSLVNSSSFIVVKLLAASFAIQVLFFMPALYWIFQNYSIIQTHLPVGYNMTENIEFEKKWILFIVLASTAMASLWNAFLWLYVYRLSREKQISHEFSELRDEAVDQRLAS